MMLPDPGRERTREIVPASFNGSGTTEAAAGYIERGWAPVPVPAGEKSPNRQGWQKLRVRAEEVPRYFKDGRNIGLHCGEPSGWLVDADLDCEEALKIAGRFLSPTLTSGRQSTPDSHWWYYAQETEYKKFEDIDGSTILELRSTGHHTLVSPSRHPSGENYSWSASGLDIERVGAASLLFDCRQLASAALIARHLPEGGRHDICMALSGFMLRRGLSEETTANIQHAAWDARGFAGDREARDAHKDIEGIVPDTAAKLQGDKRATGGGRLEELIPGLRGKLAGFWDWSGRLDDGEATPATAPREYPFPVMDDAAYRGTFGEIVEAIAPHTEADPVAILLSAITLFGNSYGRRGYMEVSGTRHHGNLFVGIVGDTARSRKGTSLSPVKNIFGTAAPEWAQNRIVGGLSSGEGLINVVRDAVEGENKDGDTVVLDKGVLDKRLLVAEGELSQGLKVLRREGNTLSPILRNAWDGGDLATLTRNAPLRATGPHISVLGHITSTELLKHLVESEAANGFGNRFLWACVRRSKKLPFGGELSSVDMSPIIRGLRSALDHAGGRMSFAPEARSIWVEMYDSLTEDRPGMFGMITARAEAQTLRLAILYALAAGSNEIRREHLASAHAVWGYCEDSALHLFGDQLGDVDADKLLNALRGSPGGMTKTEISGLFGRNKKPGDLQRILNLLEHAGKARSQSAAGETGGRPTETWYAA
jgi:hypothetical protein